MSAFVSVVIVSWNTRRHLVNCLESLLADSQSCNVEIIVVDNASSDGSLEAVAERFSVVKLIKNTENLGFAKANNIGINASSGKYICLINSDVKVLENCIDRLVAFMEANPLVGMAGPRILNPDGTLQVSCRHFPSLWNNLCQVAGFNKVFRNSRFFSEPFMKYWVHDEVRSVDAIRGCFWIIRRKALDEVGLLDERFFFYGEDIDWCKRCRNAGWQIVLYPNAEAIHHGGASSSNAPIKFYLEMQKADLQYWRKHHGHFGSMGYLIIIMLREASRFVLASVMYVLSSRKRHHARFRLKRSMACILWLLGGRRQETAI